MNLMPLPYSSGPIYRVRRGAVSCGESALVLMNAIWPQVGEFPYEVDTNFMVEVAE